MTAPAPPSPLGPFLIQIRAIRRIRCPPILTTVGAGLGIGEEVPDKRLCSIEDNERVLAVLGQLGGKVLGRPEAIRRLVEPGSRRSPRAELQRVFLRNSPIASEAKQSIGLKDTSGQ